MMLASRNLPKWGSVQSLKGCFDSFLSFCNAKTLFCGLIYKQTNELINNDFTNHNTN